MAGGAVAYLVSDFIGAAAGAFIADAAGIALAETAISGALIVESSYAVGAVIGLGVGQVAGGLVTGAFAGSDGSSAGVASAASAVSVARAQGVLINTSSNVEAVPVIYGSRKVGGSRVLLEVSGSSNEYLHFVICLCEGEIDAVSQIYLNDLPITDPRYSGLTYSEVYLGTDTQAASAALIGALPAKWTAQHTGSGLAYVYIRLQYSQNVFSGLPTFTFDVRGKKIYDPRTGLTAYSNNPALCIRDYLTNTRYGRGIAAAKIDDTAIIVAANHCDELVAIPGGTQARYTCDGVIDINNTCFDNLKTLVSTCRGMPIYSAGIYRLVIDKAQTPGFAFTEDNITGDWTIVQPGRRAKFNRVTASIFNPAANWQPDYGISDSTAYRALDAGLLLEAKMSLPFTANLYRAQQLAGLFMKQSRFGIVARFSALQEGLRAEVGDVITISHTTPGWVAKPFRIMQMELTNEDQVEVTCSEYDASVYNLDTLTAITGAPASNLPDVFNVSPPANLVLTSGTAELLKQGDGSIASRIKAVWPAPTDAFVKAVLVQYRKVGDVAWQSAPPALPSVGALWIAPVLDGATYNVRIRFENAIGSQSVWTYAADQTVIGKTDPPSAPASIGLTQSLVFFAKVTDTDLDGYIIRSQVGTTGVFSRATPMHDGRVTASPFIITTRLYGVQTIMVVAVDTTGNISPAVSATLDFGLPDSGNFVQSLDYRALGFPGALTACSVSVGDLVADALATSDVYVLTDLFGEPDVYATQYAALQWVSQSFAPAYGGATVSLAYAAAGSGVTIEYRIDGDAITDLYSSADVYASANVYGAIGAYQPWPGALAVNRMQGIQWRVSIASGTEQGKVTAFLPSLAAQEAAQTFPNLAIGSSGTRLVPANGTPARRWITLRSVQVTPFVDGSGAIAGRLLDFSPVLGPLAQLVDNTGTAVSGTATVELRGLVDV